MESSLRRYVPILIAGAALLAAACADSVAPTSTATPSGLQTLTAFGGATSAVRGDRRAEDDATPFTFVLRARGGKVRIGGFWLDYPARSVCDPATSGYGPEYWTMPCSTLGTDITITAKVWTEDGRTHADFSPDIRFDPSRDVTISARVNELKGQLVSEDWVSMFAIWYSTRVGDDRLLIDETALFPELASVFETRHGRATGLVTRKIYHFSGYYVRSGRVCDDSSESCDAESSSDNLLQ